MAKMIAVEYSLTETRQFQRLVDFLLAVDEHAEAGDDYELHALVRDCRDDLLRMRGS